MSFMNSLNLHHLKYFVDAAQEGGISQSARKNYVTQSAVSRAIASLEQTLEIELVIHRQNHFQLTEAGEAVLEKSIAIFEAVSNIKETAVSHSKTLRGPLRLGCNPSIASQLIAPALVHIEKMHPEVRPLIKLGNTDQIQRMIDSHEVDFGIVVDDGEVESVYQTQTIYTGKLIVVKSPKFKADSFKNLIVSRVQKGGLSQSLFKEYERTHRQPLTPKMVVSSWQVIMDLAIAGYGAALVPEFLCKEALQNKKLELVKHAFKISHFNLCTIVAKNKVLPKNAQALISYFDTSK